ncbi:hypothetical protein OMP38_14645 [Cohnella ginsengisoli]|uniref:Uncharacterized protein n=1 Tax=Cohnella ginsengisoli TaxID=425004 RepID=A0A9X4KLY8_9BACL|nr:hypothetical protein [Cohnella ginsengisoli]MDG0791955.1 hypothetical protein [Cohnella ginsengisoli]
MNVPDNDFFTLCRLVSDAEDWYESGQMDAVGSYLKDMQRILNNQKKLRCTGALEITQPKYTRS